MSEAVDLTIRPLDDQYQKNTEPKVLPKHPHCTIIVAPPASGKSTLLCRWCMDDVFFKNVYQRIVIFCPTSKGDEKYEKLMKEPILAIPENNREQYTDDDRYINKSDVHTDVDTFIPKLKELYDDYLKISDTKGRKYIPPTLIICDDVVGTKFLKSSILQKAVIGRRHINCSIIISTQRWCAVPKMIRSTNSNYVIVFPIFNKKELEALYEESGALVTKEQWYKIITSLFTDDEKRQFLCLNYNNPPKFRLINSFKAFLVPKTTLLG